MPKRAPHRVSKETHLKVIVILLLAVVLLLWLVHCAGPKSVREQRLPARSEKAAERAEMSEKADRSDRFDRQDQPNQPGHRVYGTQLELPLYTDSMFIVRHPEARYTLCYDTSYRQAAWVAYLLTRSEVGRKDAERANAFRCDPEVVRRGWPTARDRDYARSGYDRGHLLPSADRDDTPSENRATFYLSNVSPQCAGLNRQIWRLLEEQERRWPPRTIRCTW